MSEVLIAAEEEVMRMTARAMMLRAADVLDKLTESDVLDAQKALLVSGVPLWQVARVDRCMLGVAHLRAHAESLKNDREFAIKTRDLLIIEVGK